MFDQVKASLQFISYKSDKTLEENKEWYKRKIKVKEK